MKLLIDMDIIARKAACSADSKSGGDTGLERACYNARSMMITIFTAMETANHIGYLGTRGDRTQHRYKLYPEYKSNRKKIEYPKYLDGVRDYLVSEFNVEVVKGIEADDALSIEQHNNLEYDPHDYAGRVIDSKTIICTIDKDLMIVPGWHYHLDKKTRVLQTELEGLKCFYKQIITGDASDGIPRVMPKVIVTKWLKQLDLSKTELEMLDIVRDCYYTIYKDLGYIYCHGYGPRNDEDKTIDLEHEILWRGQLLMPLKKLNQLWSIPNEQ